MLLWVDGFEKYGEVGSNVNPAQIFKWKYSLRSDYLSVANGVTEGASLKIEGRNYRSLHTPALTANKTMIVGFALKFAEKQYYDMDDDRLIDFRHPHHYGSTSHSESLGVKFIRSGGGFELRSGFPLNTFGTTSGLNLQEDTWYYIELKVVCDDSSGTFEIHLDGEEVFNYTGDTRYSSSYYIYSHILFRNAYCDLYIDDLYICDGSGNANNDFLGTCNVKTLSPSSDVSGNWTPSTGNAMYATIDEDVQDANYISSNVSGSQAIFETNNIIPAGDVVGVAITTDSQISGNLYKHPKLLTQNGSGNVQTSGNIMPGLDNPIGYLLVLEENPDGDEWSRTNINHLRIGVEVS